MTAAVLPAAVASPEKRRDDLSAGEPPEARGLQRDEVRLLVAGGGPVRHVFFNQLGSFLRPGDLVVVNDSATLPAALDAARADGSPVKVHVSGGEPGGGVVVELRRPGRGRVLDAVVGERITLPDGTAVALLAAYPDRDVVHGSRLWQVRLPGDDAQAFLRRFGRPITYDYVRGHWPLAAYQTIFARRSGSAEMPSAGRPFSPAVVTDLVAAGVAIAPLTLHAGVSSLEAGETPLPERFEVPHATAALINATRSAGGSIVAVGTTVTRAIESVAEPDGTVTSGGGWTDLVIGPDRPVRSVDGLITGWHEPGTSHLQLLEAVAGPALVRRAYEAATVERYRWHEFGDSCLLMTER